MQTLENIMADQLGRSFGTATLTSWHKDLLLYSAHCEYCEERWFESAADVVAGNLPDYCRATPARCGI